MVPFKPPLEFGRGTDGVVGVGNLYPMPVHIHDELEANLILEGGGTYQVGSSAVPVEAGQVIWLFPGQLHQFSDVSADLHLVTLKWRSPLVDRIAGQGDELSLWMRRPAPDHTVIGRIPPERLESLAHLSGDVLHQSGAVKNQGLIYLLTRLWSESERTRDANKRILPGVVRRALAELGDTGREVDAKALAKELGVSYSHLARLFKQETGYTIGEARNVLRLQSFFECYRGESSILQAAMNAGFGSYVQFYRVFRQHYGQGPQEYLQRSEQQQVELPRSACSELLDLTQPTDTEPAATG